MAGSCRGTTAVAAAAACSMTFVASCADAAEPTLHVLPVNEPADRGTGPGAASLAHTSQVGALAVLQPMPGLLLTIKSTLDDGSTPFGADYDTSNSNAIGNIANEVRLAFQLPVGIFKITPSIGQGYTRANLVVAGADPASDSLLSRSSTLTLRQDLSLPLVLKPSLTFEPFVSVQRQWTQNRVDLPSIEFSDVTHSVTTRFSAGLTLSSPTSLLKLEAYRSDTSGVRDTGATVMLTLPWN